MNSVGYNKVGKLEDIMAMKQDRDRWEKTMFSLMGNPKILSQKVENKAVVTRSHREDQE